MFITYLFRELTNRRKQTAIIAIGMALAIALVIIVNGVAAGVRDAQATVLASVYGVGTDITVSQTSEPVEPGTRGPGGQRFNFGSEDGASEGGSTVLNQTQLTVAPGTSTFDASTIDAVVGVDNVQAATTTLALNNTSFSGEIPDFSQGPPAGGAGGDGGRSFEIESFTVQGIDIAGEAVGPLTAVTLTDGRTFTSDDTGTNVAVLDATYASTSALAVGDTVTLGGEGFEVIGMVASGSSDATTASNAYIPLDTAQRLSGLDDQVSSIYVEASSSEAIAQIKADLESELPEATISTQEDLASSVSGSLSTASDLVSSLGTWLSIIVLAAAFLIAILFTISGVTRRTREFGTLKAIGWSNSRVVGQVAGESLVQGAIGGVIGVGLGLLGVLAINTFAPSLSASTAVQTAGVVGPGGGGRGGFGGGGLPGAEQALSTTDVVLNASVPLTIILAAVLLSLLGGLIAGVLGGWRASRLRPAEALRSVA